MSQIKCPECGHRFAPTEVTARQIEGRLRKQIESEQAKFIEKERAAMEKAALKKVSEQFSLELKDLRDALEEKEHALEASNKQELALRKRQRALEERESSLKLEIERQMENERKKLSEQITNQATDIAKDKIAQKDRLIGELKITIDSLQQKTEQISQKLQGSAREDVLEEALRRQFPHDVFERIKSGNQGGDIVHKVMVGGNAIGSIIFESKQSKSWVNNWIPKLKNDQQSISADLAVLVSDVLPEGLQSQSFGRINDVLVTRFDSVIGLTGVLRASLIEISRIKSSSENAFHRGEILLGYMNSARFRNGIVRVIETFGNMRDSLEKERNAAQRCFAKRESEMRAVVESIATIVGDIQGCASILSDIEVLQLNGAHQ